MATTITNPYEGLRVPKQYSTYTLLRGVTDFGNLAQFNLYESGYAHLVVLQIPRFIKALTLKNDDIKNLVDAYVQALEGEFKSLDGLDDITVDTLELTDGISSVSVISKVNQQSQSTVSLRYYEKAGTVFTRFNELYLTALRDPRTQVKRYKGLLDPDQQSDDNSGSQKIDLTEAGYENEVFTFLYFVTDNTMTKVERAYLLIAAQPTKADNSIFNYEKGSIENKELTLEFNCFPVTGKTINVKAKKYLDWINSVDAPANRKLIVDSSNFEYTAGITNAESLPDFIKTDSTTGKW